MKSLETSVNSLVFAAASALLALVVGWVTAWIVERTNTPLKPLAYLTAIISLGTPYILYVTAWLYLLGRAGPFNDLYRSLIDPDATPFNVNSLAGMVMIEGFLWSPLVFLLLSSSFRAANAEMEEAARMAGATVAQTMMRISLKLAWPAILALALFVFIRNLESFEVPALVGMPGRVDRGGDVVADPGQQFGLPMAGGRGRLDRLPGLGLAEGVELAGVAVRGDDRDPAADQAPGQRGVGIPVGVPVRPQRGDRDDDHRGEDLPQGFRDGRGEAHTFWFSCVGVGQGRTCASVTSATPVPRRACPGTRAIG